MKRLLIIVFVFRIFEASSQVKLVDSIAFCGKTISIPTGCHSYSQYQMYCDDYFMFWFYTSEALLKSMVNTFVNKSLKEFGNCKQDTIEMLLLDEKVSTIKLLCTVEGKPISQCISYGIVKGQPVMSVLNLYKNVTKDSDLPESVRQIVTIK